MVKKFSTPGLTDEAHDARHAWSWLGGVRGVPGAHYTTAKRAVYQDAYTHQIEEAKRGNLVNVKVERLQENEDTGDYQWGIMTQPAYCPNCSVESGNSWRAPQRTTVRISTGSGNQGPMLRQEQELHAQLQANPDLIK